MNPQLPASPLLEFDDAVPAYIEPATTVRATGTSHHYAPPSRTITANPAATAILTETLIEHGVPFIAGRTWTTDAPYRETPGKIATRRAEGCVTVEMEAAALAAVAAFRGVALAQVLYGGDDLSGETWDHRSWHKQADVRDNLLQLAGTAAVRLQRAVTTRLDR